MAERGRRLLSRRSAATVQFATACEGENIGMLVAEPDGGAVRSPAPRGRHRRGRTRSSRAGRRRCQRRAPATAVTAVPQARPGRRERARSRRRRGRRRGSDVIGSGAPRASACSSAAGRRGRAAPSTSRPYAPRSRRGSPQHVLDVAAEQRRVDAIAVEPCEPPGACPVLRRARVGRRCSVHRGSPRPCRPRAPPRCADRRCCRRRCDRTSDSSRAATPAPRRALPARSWRRSARGRAALRARRGAGHRRTLGRAGGGAVRPSARAIASQSSSTT